MTKDDARKQALRLWRDLPIPDRQSFAQAEVFAVRIEPALDFETMGGKLKVITAWLNRDLLDLEEVRTSARRRADEHRSKRLVG